MSLDEKDIQLIFQYYTEERYQDALDLLEDIAPKDKNNHHIFYLKAICYIQMNKLDDAFIELGEVAYLNPDYVPSMHSIAYIFLRKGDFESAIDKWLAIRSIAPKDPLANQILDNIKTKKLQKDSLNRYNINDFIQLDFPELKKGLFFQKNLIQEPIKPLFDIHQNTLKPQILLKKTPKNKSIFYRLYHRKIVILSSFAILGIIIFFLWGYQPFSIQNSLTLSNDTITLYSFKEEEINNKLQNLEDIIKEKNYNKSIIAINELYLSNITSPIKQKLEKYKQSLRLPRTIDQAGDPILLQEALDNIYLYKGTYTQQEGIVDNFLYHQQYITFDLIIPQINKPIPHIYFITPNIDELPFRNKDTVRSFGFLRTDENKAPIIEVNALELIKTGSL